MSSGRVGLISTSTFDASFDDDSPPFLPSGHPNAFQACDVFADLTGWPVIGPDFFRGKPWTVESMESLGGLPGMTTWAHKTDGKGPWEGIVGPGNWEHQVKGWVDRLE